MKNVNLMQSIKNPAGFELTVKTAEGLKSPLQLYDVLSVSLMSHHPQRDAGLTGSEMHRMYQLAQRIDLAKAGTMDFSEEEADLLKNRVAICYEVHHAIVGSIWDILS